MIYIDSFHLPSEKQINDYFSSSLALGSPYPWNIFFQNQFEWVECKDITMFYGNNGSGKSTLLNLLAEKINAQRNNELFKDVIYDDRGIEYHPFDDFVNRISLSMGMNDNGESLLLPITRKLITSNDIFRKIEELSKHNRKAVIEIEEARKQRDSILSSQREKQVDYNDYAQLSKLLEARKYSKSRYASIHAPSKQQLLSNGETALQFYSHSFESGGIYLLDEPENCLSPVFQIELIKLIEEAVKYFDCQFILCTHSPLLLSMSHSVIYNLDMTPVIPQNWEELENIKIYYDFFMSKMEKFECLKLKGTTSCHKHKN